MKISMFERMSEDGNPRIEKPKATLVEIEEGGASFLSFIEKKVQAIFGEGVEVAYDNGVKPLDKVNILPQLLKTNQVWFRVSVKGEKRYYEVSLLYHPDRQ